MRSLRHGFNLIEAAIVLAVVGLVIGGIWVAAATVRENMLANTIASGFLSTIGEMRNKIPPSLVAGMAPPAGVTLQYQASTTMIASMKLAPADWIKSNNSIVLPTGQTLYIYANEVSGVPMGYINFTAGSPPYFSPSLCMKVVPRIINSGLPYNMSVSGQAGYYNSASTKTTSWFRQMCMAHQISTGDATISTLTISFPLSQ